MKVRVSNYILTWIKKLVAIEIRKVTSRRNATSFSSSIRVGQKIMSKADRAVAWWLGSVCVVVFCMIIVGGVTRLTHSGLSMVDW